MYNRQRKEDFIESYNAITTSTFLETIFNKTAFYEEHYEKDVCDFILSEIIELFRSYGSSSKETLRTRASILRTYTYWCIENNLSYDNINHYEELTTDHIISCVNKVIFDKKYFGRKQLDTYANGLNNACDKFILYALFEGIKGENYDELINLGRKDIDYLNKRVKLCSGRELEVSKELIDLAVQSVDTYEYYSLKDDELFVSSLKEDSDLVLKPRNNVTSETEAAAYQRLVKRIARIKKELDAPELTIPRVFNSGILDSIKESSKEHDMSPIDFCKSEYYDAIAERFQIKNKPVYQIVNTFREYF